MVFFSTDPTYITCLFPDCGKYFSTDDCKPSKRKQKIECPYCHTAMCLTCIRPWDAHGRGGCKTVKQKEEEETAAVIKQIGANPCPKCGLNIQKHGGCDHMTCKTFYPFHYSLKMLDQLTVC